jgi:hypothetical protein
MFVWVWGTPFVHPAGWQEVDYPVLNHVGNPIWGYFYTGSWVPWADIGVDMIGIAGDVATYVTGGEPIPTGIASAIELSWSLNKAANGDATSMYAMERQMLNAAAAVPYQGTGASIASIFLNVDEISQSWEQRLLFIETWDGSFPNYPPPLKGK